MDSAAHSALRHPELVTEAAPVAPESARALTVTAVYHLSEAGRKASLLAGGDGRAVQQITVQVSASRLHLVSVDVRGVARLKLRPRYDIDANQRVVRLDDAPTYDVPPTVDELFREAARNHERERVYQAERTVTRAKKREADHERRLQVAQAFLTDRTQRALVHPAPSPRRCYVSTDQGRVLFDVATDEGPARDVPPEAHRRFRADLAAKREKNLQDRTAQLALHEEKKRYIAAWITEHGTLEQQARQAAGVLPMEEAIEAITDQAFVAIADHPPYARDGAERLQAHLREFPEYADVVVSPADLVVLSSNAATATAEQWAVVQSIQKALPGATVMLRAHRLTWRKRPQAPSLTLFGVLVAQKVGPFMVRREYARNWRIGPAA
jgi:hypothetical protein